jgi:hypothetical protein
LPAAAVAAAEERLWVELVAGKLAHGAALSVIEKAANAVITVYNKHILPLWTYADQRHVASLYAVSSEELNSIPFKEMLTAATAMPMKEDDGPVWSWNPSVGAPPAAMGGAEAAADDPPDLIPTVGQRLVAQWFLFKTRSVIKGGETFITEADRVSTPSAAKYWVRTRPLWPDLSELMLFWLCVPVSTAGLERGFSLQTLLDQNTRRRGRKFYTMRDDMLIMVHRVWLDERLEMTLG